MSLYNYEKSLLVTKSHEIDLDTNLIFKTPQPLYFQVEPNRTFDHINTDLNSGLLVKNAQNPKCKFSELFTEAFSIQDPINLFTDGSKIVNDNGSMVGCASWSVKPQFVFKYKLYDKSSIFTAEAIAILKSLDNIGKSNFKSFCVFSDSLSVLGALQNTKNRRNQNHLIQMLNNSLYKLSKEGKYIRLIWIPSHLGIEGNEQADFWLSLGP